MKKILMPAFLLIVLQVLTTPVLSQEKNMAPPEDRAAKLTEWMKTNLQLTPEQEPKVQEINLKYAHKMDELKKSTAGKRQKFQMLKKDDQAKDAELKQVFTADQYKTYQAKKDELKKKLKEEMKERKQG